MNKKTLSQFTSEVHGRRPRIRVKTVGTPIPAAIGWKTVTNTCTNVRHENWGLDSASDLVLVYAGLSKAILPILEILQILPIWPIMQFFNVISYMPLVPSFLRLKQQIDWDNQCKSGKGGNLDSKDVHMHAGLHVNSFWFMMTSLR